MQPSQKQQPTKSTLTDSRTMRSSTAWQGAIWAAASIMGPVLADNPGLVDRDYVCTHPPYKPLLISASPLLIYLENFLSEQERRHLHAISHGKFSPSAARAPPVAYVPRDAVLRCIEERAVAFQGYDVVREQLEPLQLVRHAPGEQEFLHTDWITQPAEQALHATASSGGNRLSTFLAYVHVGKDSSGNETTGGGTRFSLLDATTNEEWCRRGLVDCDAPWESGLTLRPVAGNAVFWRNLKPVDTFSTTGQREGDTRTLHAELPVGAGEKIRLNIWTREGVLSEEARGPEFDGDG